MILWFLNFGYSGTLFGMWFLTLAQQLFLLIISSIGWILELMGKEKGYKSSHVHCQAKGWSKKSQENFLNDFGKGFWNGMTEREKMRSHQKGFLKLKCLSPLKMLIPSLFEETFGAFLFSFLPLFFSSVPWGLRGFDDIWGENHFFKNFFSIGFNILAVDAYSRVELCMPTWLNHDYGDGGVVDILAVDAYSRVDVCMPIFMGEASN
jgi:hypothetical protein